MTGLQQENYVGLSAEPKTRGEVNNNPGNIDYNPKNAWLGMVPYSISRAQDTRFCVFTSPLMGLRAMAILIRHLAKPCGTYAAIISAWAPAGENNTAAYIKNVMEFCHTDNPHIDVGDKTALGALMSAIIRQENGRCIYPAELIQTAIGLSN